MRSAGDLTADEARARSGLIEVESYDIFLDLTAEPPRSRTEIRFSCREPGASTFAEVTAVSMGSAVLNGLALSEPRDGRLALPDVAAHNVLEVELELGISRSGQALTRFTDPADNATYVTLTCYPTSAPDIFCCFDQPDLSAAMTISVRVPADWECVGNGPVARRPPSGQGGTWEFETVPAMRPYDVALCAGPFTTQWRVDHPVQVSARRRRSLAGADGVEGLAWFGELAVAAIERYAQVLGTACPSPSYDIVVVPDLGPMAYSVHGLMLVSERMLGRLADPQDDFATMICAHEVAHLWFGGLVGMRWWDDVWLDEAVATYVSYSPAISPVTTGGGWTAFGYRDKDRAYQADQLPTTEPVSAPVATSAQAHSRPNAITYIKGASVIRQLAALIGDDALHAGFGRYLRRHGPAGVASLDDLITCMSLASGRDLDAWAQEWLRTTGASTLSPELVTAPDGTISSLTVLQESPRTHLIQLGLYDLEGRTLRRRRTVTAEVSGTRTSIPAVTGERRPSALVLNEGDLTYARIGFDEQTLSALAVAAMDVGDPLTEAVCWNGVWHLLTDGGLAAADLVDLVVRRLGTLPLIDTEPLTRIDLLVQRAVSGADAYAPPAARGQLRERLAECVLGLASKAPPGRAHQRVLAEAFAASAQSQAQLELLRSWLSERGLPAGLAITTSLRGQILLALSTRGLATDADLDALVALDPVQGEPTRATCLAARPEAAAKELAWARALAADQGHRLAQACALGVWRPGQEAIMEGYGDRYFAEALTALAGRDQKTMRTVGRDLFPSTLISTATIEASDAALAGGKLPGVLANAVGGQLATMRSALKARSAPRRPSLREHGYAP